MTHETSDKIEMNDETSLETRRLVLRPGQIIGLNLTQTDHGAVDARLHHGTSRRWQGGEGLQRSFREEYFSSAFGQAPSTHHVHRSREMRRS